MKFAVSLIALLAATGFANAADLGVDAVWPTTGLQGVVEVGVLATHVDDNNDDYLWVSGGYASAALWDRSASLIWGIDGYIDGNSFDRDEDDDIPTYVGVIGGHVGFDTGTGSLGAFASLGAISDDNDDFTTRFGFTAGVEGIVELTSGLSLFGQLGYADARPDEDRDDDGFTGAFGRVGALYALSDDIAVMADLSAGSGDDYNDGEPGGFVAAGAKAAFRLPTDFDAFLTAGYEYAHYTAESDDSEGTTHTVKLGVSFPFGDSTTAPDTLNPLATSALPYRAGSWSNAVN